MVYPIARLLLVSCELSCWEMLRISSSLRTVICCIWISGPVKAPKPEEEESEAPPAVVAVEPSAFIVAVGLIVISDATSFIALCTMLRLFSMPSASPPMKSGIQLSKSVSGPSSGTEKCRKDRMVSATLVTALVTLLMQLLIPFTMPLIISAPQLKAEDARFLMKLTAC